MHSTSGESSEQEAALDQPTHVFFILLIVIEYIDGIGELCNRLVFSWLVFAA